MSNQIVVYMLRVFVDAFGNYGDRASIIIDEGEHISREDRQKIAHKLNTGETIFINNIEQASISVMHSQGEIGFAGVGVLGVAWFLSKIRNKPTENMQGRDGQIICWQEEDRIWAQTSLPMLPQWHFTQRVSKREIEEMKVAFTKNIVHTMFWAWADKEKGLIRARTFAYDWGIPEAEGNGSGAMLLATMVKRHIVIEHGKGSVLFARPESNISASIGGRVSEDQSPLRVSLELDF